MIQQRLDAFQAWLGQLNESRRLLFFIAMLLLTLFFWSILLHHPLRNSASAKIQRKTDLQHILQDLQTKSTLTEKDIVSKASVEGQAQQIAIQLQRLIATTPPVATLREQLTKAMTNQPGIQFLGLKISDPKPWFPSGNSHIDLPAGAEKLQRYQIEMHFTGGYQDTFDFLTQLAGLPWHLSWDTLTYQVVNYPTADVTVTFSLTGIEGKAT